MKWTKADARSLSSILSRNAAALHREKSRISSALRHRLLKELAANALKDKFLALSKGTLTYMMLRAGEDSRICNVCADAFTKGVTCESCMKDPELRQLAFKKRSETIRRSNMTKYGVSNPMKLNSVRRRHAKAINAIDREASVAKARRTNQKRYGADNPMHSKRVKAKHQEAVDQIDYAAAAAKTRITCLERYGVTNASKDPDVVRKILSASASTKKYTASNGKTYTLQGYEPLALEQLLSKFPSKAIEAHPDGFDLGPFSFHPDFYIKSRQTYVEVKSEFTLLRGVKGFKITDARTPYQLNRAKARLCEEKGIRVLWLIVFPKLGKTAMLPKDWHTMTRKSLTNILQEFKGLA